MAAQESQESLRKATPIRKRRTAIVRLRILVVGATLGLLLAILSFTPLAPFQQNIPNAFAHAFLLKSDPAAGAILQAPPSQVRLWYSENVNGLTSHAVVVDPANHQVDNKDTHVSSSNSKEMDIGLPLLPAGTYVVAWQVQSADDGHVTSGSFFFRIARPDGSIPSIPNVLPTGHFPGAAGTGATGNTLDGPSLFQAISTWLALLIMTFWVGGIFWETWILPPDASSDQDLRAAAGIAHQRFRRAAPYALGLLLIADVGLVLAEGVFLAGDWSGAFSLPLLGAIIFGSRFGTFWLMRQIVTAAALAITLFALPKEGKGNLAKAQTLADFPLDTEAPTVNGATIPDWRQELVQVLRRVPQLPQRLVAGFQRQQWPERILCLLGIALLVAFAFSGHAAAVPASEFAYAIAVDLFHLFCTAAWLGGLFYIGFLLIPATNLLQPRQRARVLALGLPQFSALAIVCAFLLATTGSLNATIRLTSWTQFLTTTYGRTLAVKIELFIIMVAISAYHAFFLRPRLAQELNLQAAGKPQPSSQQQDDDATQQTLVGVAGASKAAPAKTASMSKTANTGKNQVSQSSQSTSRAVATPQPRGAGSKPPDTSKASNTDDGSLSPRARNLEERLRDWLRREALLGGAVLLCVALLAIFAGSLAPTLASSTSNNTSGNKGPFIATQTVNHYAVTIKITPDIFGSNTFFVTVKDANGQPVTGAGVIIATSSLDMDMGTQSTQLKEIGNTAPGSYSGQAEVTMAGHWQVVVKILPPKSSQPLTSTFQFQVTY